MLGSLLKHVLHVKLHFVWTRCNYSASIPAGVGFVVSLGGSGVVLLLLLQEVLSFNPTSSVMAVVSVGEAKAFLAHGPRSKGHVGV